MKKPAGASQRIVRSSQPAQCLSRMRRWAVARIFRGMPAYDQKLWTISMLAGSFLAAAVMTNDDPSWQRAQCGQKIYRHASR